MPLTKAMLYRIAFNTTSLPENYDVEYCPDTTWAVIGMRRREVLEQRIAERRLQMKILELMTQYRVAKCFWVGI